MPISLGIGEAEGKRRELAYSSFLERSAGEL